MYELMWRGDKGRACMHACIDIIIMMLRDDGMGMARLGGKQLNAWRVDFSLPFDLRTAGKPYQVLRDTNQLVMFNYIIISDV